MIKRMTTLNSNISGSVEFLLAGAKKRRAMAMTSAKTVNSDMGVEKRRLLALN